MQVFSISAFLYPPILRHFYTLYYLANPEFKHASQPMKLKAIFMPQQKRGLFFIIFFSLRF